MSDFSDRVQEVFKQIAGLQEEESGGVTFTLIRGEHDARKSALSSDFMLFDSVWSVKFYSIVRRAYREQAGSVIPGNYPEMHEKVKELVTESLVPFYKQCLAAGIQMGQEEDKAVKRAKRLNRQGELFRKDEFTSECALMAMSWDADFDLESQLSQYLEGSAVHLATHTGLPASNDPEMILRAWDAWCVSGRSLMAMCYSAGEVIGQQNKEANFIANAAKQMEEKDD